MLFTTCRLAEFSETSFLLGGVGGLLNVWMRATSTGVPSEIISAPPATSSSILGVPTAAKLPVLGMINCSRSAILPVLGVLTCSGQEILPVLGVLAGSAPATFSILGMTTSSGILPVLGV